MSSKVNIFQKLKYARKQSLTYILCIHKLKPINKWQETMF